MKFKIIDTTTGKEPTEKVITKIAKNGGLIVMDIDQFYIGEDGTIALADECGNLAYVDMDRFKIEGSNGTWKITHKLDDQDVICYRCSECGSPFPYKTRYCPNCSSRMNEVVQQ